MKVLQVIHGYPMRYNAGSEVYTHSLAHALAERHEVHVFTRQENAFFPEYAGSAGIGPLQSRYHSPCDQHGPGTDGYRHHSRR